ncbi:GtrA-like protein [mine drainage metagenome]|uniref:GtrA-like protein n=1 Tax=mine drainage metagenome TaxID=410659 RepID=A0A1J5REE3_9ZZZZ
MTQPLTSITSLARELLVRHETKARYLVAGGLNTLFGLGFYPLAYFLLAPLRSNYLLLLILSQIPCVTFSFLTNKFLVFKTNGNYAQEYTKFATYYASIFAINLASLPLLVEVLAMKPIWAQTLFSVVTITASYFWHSRITFSNTPKLHDS